MYNNRARNIIINMPDRKPVSSNRTTPDNNQVKLAAYYTRIFAGTMEKMHIPEEQKRSAVWAVNMEYSEILATRGYTDMVS